METIEKSKEAPETIEVNEPEAKPEVKAPARDDLKAQGWSAKELEAAEKRGMIAKPEEAEAQKKESEAKAKADAEAKVKAESDKESEGDKKVDQKSSIPDFTFKTPEQEKAFLDAFGSGTPQRAMYFRMKNERAARQAFEQRAIAAEKKAQELEARVKAIEAGKPTQELDEDGNPIDPADKPLTEKRLRELQQKEAEEIEKQKSELNARARIVAEAQTTQEEYARSLYEDFDTTVEKAKEVMQKLDTLIPEKWKQAKVVKLIRDLQIAAANADKIDLDDYHAAHIAYEIGQFHPDYGKKADPSKNGDASDKDGNSKDPKKANGGLTPEQMKRIEDNTQRRASSASIPGGGGKRTISVDDVDLATLTKMSYAERQKFREKHPDRYAKLLRG